MRGFNTYPDDWPEIAERVKRAARYRCEQCDHKHEPAAGYTLTVHHLDLDKSNCHWRNLVALCQRCHLRVQASWRPGQLWLDGQAPAWAVWRGYVPGVYMPELTVVDRELLEMIRARTIAEGAARSLFQLAVVDGGLTYPWAWQRLNVLEMLGYVRVERPGGGQPLIMRAIG